MIIDKSSNSRENNLSVGASLPVGWRAWVSRYHLDIGFPAILLAVSVTLFIVSISRIDLLKISDVGLISALPLTVFLAGLVLTASFLFCLSQPELRTPLVLLHILVLVVLLSGIPSLIEQVPRFNVTWRHAGIVEAINRLGKVYPNIDAYFNWPVFFILSALVVKVAGLQGALSLAPWFPVFVSFIYLGPLVMIFDSATRDRRLVWLGIWIFYLANWIGQDYFSPQGFNFFLYLALLGILLKWFKAIGKETGEHKEFRRLGRLARPVSRLYKWITANEDSPDTPVVGNRSRLIGIWILIFTLVVSSHQLTPFAVFFSVSALVIIKRVGPRYLPFLMGGLIVIWLLFMAQPYLRGHLPQLLAQIGQLGDVVNDNVAQRLGGSPGHNLVVRASFVMTLGIWGLAFLGFVRRLRKGRLDAAFVLLALTPFILLGLQAYGGEMLLRVYLFSLPFMAFFAAGLVFPDPKEIPSWWKLVAVGLVSFLLLGGFYLTRYGNEKMEQFSLGEVDAVRYLYSVAEPGSEIAASSAHYPAKFENYEQYTTIFLPDETLTGNLPAIISRMEYKAAPARYLILTRSQEAYLHLFDSMTSTTWDQLVQSLEESPRFKLIFSNQDAKVFLLVEKSVNGVQK